MTRARWLIGFMVAAAAMIVGAQALATYLAGRLVVGIAAVIVLMAVLAIGLASLAQARRHIERELRALAAAPPGGQLLGQRRQQLEELHRRGAIADLDALADATAAQEAERGYAGKYLVATTVLIGLVGTFGGLMETLRRLPPLLTGDGSGTLALLAGPLAGLHVTFGASVVAILVTLALGIVQGDVTLHHERLLALLEERTRHHLVPALWPARDGAVERTARELVELRALIEGALATGVEATATRVGAVVHQGIERLVDEVSGALRAHGAAQTAAMQDAATAVQGAGAAMIDGLRRTTEEMSATLGRGAAAFGEAALASRQALADAATEIGAAVRASQSHAREDASRVARAVEEAAAASAETTRATMAALAGDVSVELARSITATAEQSQALEQAIAAQTARAIAAGAEQSRALREEIGAQMAHAAARLETTAETVAALAQRSTQALESGGQTVFEALRGLGGDVAARLGAASTSLTGAAADLRGAVEALSPAVAELVPELAALAQELALLAARAENAEQPSAVLDELLRLGEDVERLIGLARAGGPTRDEPSPFAAPALSDGPGSLPAVLAPTGPAASDAGAGDEEPLA